MLAIKDRSKPIVGIIITMSKDEQPQLLYITKSVCDFCEEPTYNLIMARDADSSEPLLVCEECATTFGGDFKNIKNK